MSYTLIIAEKPSASQKIASALAEGKIQTEGKRVRHYTLEHGGKKIVVAPAVGHLYGLSTDTKGYPVFDVQWAPAHQTNKTAQFTKDYLHQLLSLGKGADEIVAATDFDIEGEVIAANIIELGLKVKSAKRMKFSTLTKEELIESYQNRLPSLDSGMVDAGRTRHYLDFIWGISLSRALMTSIKKAGVFRVLSVGRVQGPALAILAEKEKAISAFRPEPYWELQAKVKDTPFGHGKNPFRAKDEADAALARTTSQGVVERVQQEQYQVPAPFPYDLTTLQVDAYRAFGYTPAQTLQHAQGLYEAAVISYPRTASQKLPAKLNLAKIISQLSKQGAYAKPAEQLLAQKRFIPREGVKEDPAHPAIHPTGQTPATLFAQQQKVYDLIVRRFLATFAEPATRERQQVTVKLGEEPYHAKGARTLKPGWMTFFPYAKFEEVELPAFEQGERVLAKDIEQVQKETQPPKRYSAASLVKKLESINLGTKATRSEIIETLFRRGYAQDKKAIKVTPLGLSVHDALSHDAAEILSEGLTRKFEEEMEQIQAGNKKPEEVQAEGRAVLSKIAGEIKQNELDLGKRLLTGLQTTEREVQVLGPCPTCQKGQIVIKRSRFGLFGACDQYPNCKQTYPFPKQGLIKPTGKTCEFCKAPIVMVVRKARRPFTMCLTYGCKSKESWGKPGEKKELAPSENVTGPADPAAPVGVALPKPPAQKRAAGVKRAPRAAK